MFEDEKFNKKFDELVLIVNELMQLKEKYKEFIIETLSESFISTSFFI